MTVFISSNNRDSEWLQSFAHALEHRGFEVWRDSTEIDWGDSWREALETGLRTSDVLVAVLDAELPATPNVLFELGAALGMGKTIVPIVPRGANPQELPLNRKLHRYLIRDTPERTAEELSQTLQAA